LEERLAQKEAELMELKQRLAALEQLVSQLNPKGK
jgi:cell division protein FtsB